MITRFQKAFFFSITTLSLTFIMFFMNTVTFTNAAEITAEVTKAAVAEHNQRIYDDANLLSTNEIDKLETLSAEYGNEAGIEIIILTHNSAKAKDAEIYIEDFYDKMLYGDSVILLVDMYNRDVCLEGYGLAETYIHSKRGDVIISEITPYLTDEKYATAFEIFISSSALYMKDDSELNYDHNYVYENPPSNSTDPYNDNFENSRPNNTYQYNYTNYSYHEYSTENFLANPLIQLIISLIIGGIVVGIMVHHSGGKMTAGSNNYIDGSNSGLIGRRDNYIRTTLTRVRKPTQNNNPGGGFNAGGFKGGMSGGGHSHSTSRGKF